ncbi:Synaptotagmin-like protein 2 [Liparis tanakae]|uniref:Synaptotagmin-like protein 2 n=1 Tax=Liparis tanakae TaxID=230148 RepID=A0A4Z2H1T9_9TELE|nr:Synaptotagmin-like protein 2 [Liparis tanakae]
MRRATSMFLLMDPEEKERTIDVSPVHSQSRKQRQNVERGAPPRRPAEDTETLTPRARAYVPKDYRHYLGMTDETTSHNYLAPAVTDEGSGGKYGYEFDLDGPDLGRDIDSTYGDSYRTGRLMTGSSLNNLTSSSGMSSLSSLSGSMMTMYSADFGNVDVQGNIQFSINYIQKLREFHIFVTKCQGLAAVDPKRGRSDPYVKSYLVPDKANLGKRKTSVKKKTQNPTFNEILRYRVRMEYLRTQTLILSVWHHDTFGKNSFLGEVDVNLSKWNFDHTQMNYLALKARTPYTLAPSLGQGEMRLAIRFLPEVIHSEGLVKEGPNTGEVHIWVKECKNLPAIRATIDPYVKCFMLPDISRKSRQKTRVLRRTLDPAFNHTMVYDGIRQADLSEACVELIVWDQDRLASNLLGGLRLGVGKGKSYGAVVDWMDSTPYEAALWERMMTTPNEWVEDVLPLRVMNSSKTRLR